MKTRVLACLSRLAMALLLLAILLPEAQVLAAPPDPGAEQVARPLEVDAAPPPDASALKGNSRTLTFPAQSLNYNPASGIITQYGGGTTAGLRWTDSFASAAFLNIPRPPDWNGTSPVLMHLYFTPIEAGSGTISFFIRPRAYDPGGSYGDSASLSSDAVPYASRVLKQTFTIPPERFGTKALWVIAIQRSSTNDTYDGAVNLLSVGLSYGARSTPEGAAGYPANALNYNASLGAIIPYGGGTSAGLQWLAGGGAGSAAFLDIPRPADWDGASSIVMHIYFKPRTSSSGYVNWFIRPRSYNTGSYHGDASSVTSSAVYLSGADVVQRQSFTIPAGTLSGSLWVIGMQRGATGETYPDDIILLAVDLSYAARSPDIASLGFPANGLNYNPASGNAVQSGGGTVAGLSWTGTGTAIFLDIPRPADWDGTSDVTMRLHYATMTTASGLVDFFIRPRGYNPGDGYADASSVSAPAVAAGGRVIIGRQSFTIPSTRFGSKELWVIAIQRGGAEQTYNDEVLLLAAELNYRAVGRIYLPLVMK
jgi:hypothetical protein